MQQQNNVSTIQKTSGKQTINRSVVCWLQLLIAGPFLFVFANPLLAVEATNKELPLRDVVIVVPDSWQASLSKWQDFRKSQGYRVQIVSPRRTAEETREAIKTISERTGSQFDCVVLAADAPDFQISPTDPSQIETVPTFYVNSKVVVRFGSTPTIASDHPYADWRQDGNHHTVVGRIPATSAKELEEYCDRVIQYDTANTFNASQKQIDIVAGVGGFGALTDTVVESMTRQLLSEDIPREYQLSMMQASPSSVYYPNPLLFSQTALERLNRGSLLWIYLGHGFVNTLDMIPYEDRLLPILTSDQLPKIKVAGLPPLAIFLACYLGAFDAKGGCLAEKMIMQQGGPIAAIAGSRVTMPYGMGILGGGMLEATFRDQRSTIGEILTRAKHSTMVEPNSRDDEKQTGAPETASKPSRRQFLDTLATSLSPDGHDIALEREEHCYLFNLLGDPLLKISRPATIELNAPQSIQQGELIVVSGTSPIEGRCEIEIVYPRKRIPDQAKKIRVAIQRATSDKLELQQQLFDAANVSVIATAVIPSVHDTFRAEFDTKNIPTGQLEIRVSIYGDSGWGVKSIPIEIKKLELFSR